MCTEWVKGTLTLDTHCDSSKQMTLESCYSPWLQETSGLILASDKEVQSWIQFWSLLDSVSDQADRLAESFKQQQDKRAAKKQDKSCLLVAMVTLCDPEFQL